MRLSEFIEANTKQIISEWEVFAQSCTPAAHGMKLEERRDHVAEMLRVIARDLETPQTPAEQVQKAKGDDDASVDSPTAANAHGTDRAATGYTPEQMVGEFRSLRASVVRLWSESNPDLDRTSLRDLTRFHEAIDQLLVESLTKYAQEVQASKDLFLGVLGHDLRNPLGAIMMSATLMMKKEGPDWPHLATVSRIVRSGARMDEMIRDLIDLTRTRLGAGIPVECKETDLEEVGRQAVEEIAAFHRDSSVRFEASGDLRGEWDAARIGQALSNLVGNAYQHGARGAPIDVVLRGEPDSVLLSVRNRGPVIAQKDIRGIFEPFKQLPPRGDAPSDTRSLGLGLYIVRAIAAAHHGSVSVESTERDGTTFSIRLPRRHVSQPCSS
jgi:signal transduction histidine kinase